MRWRAVAPGVLTVAAITGAAMLWHDLPVNSQIYAPFEVTADAGAAATGRNLTVTVTGTQITPVIRPENARPPQFDAVGIWVVVEATVAAISEPGLLRAELQVGPDTYMQSDRLLPGAYLTGTMQPAIEHRGSWMFDVSPDVLGAVDSAELRVWLGDDRLDSRLVVRIPLSGPQVGRLETVPVPRPVVSAR